LGGTGIGSESGSKTVVIGENPSAGVLSAAPRIADERGFVEESDVTFEYRQYGVGIEIMRNLSSGQANFGADGATWAALLMGAQGDVSYASHSWDAPLEQFIVQEDVQEVTDLEGRTIAAIDGSIWDWLTAKMFQQADGISIDDVEIKNFSSPSDILAALQSERIAGGWLFLQTLTEAKKSDTLYPLIDLRDVAPRAAETFGAMTWQQSWAEENQDAAAETLRMVEEGQKVMKEEPEAAASTISETYEIPEDQVLSNLQDTSLFVGLRDELVSEVFQDMYQFAVERDIYEEYDWKQAVSVEIAEQAFPDKVTWSR
jgi:ABC-type nitrate/sulfonate/bicarbonate transport system substrate-binding protein